MAQHTHSDEHRMPPFDEGFALPLPTTDSLASMAAALANWPAKWAQAGVLPWGILTDPHGWPDRTGEVLQAFASLGIPPSRLICLGDLVDYGPLPVSVIRMVKPIARVICGNHDVFAVSQHALLNGSGMTESDWAFLAECVHDWPYWRATMAELFDGAPLPDEVAARAVLFIHDSPTAVEKGPGSAGNRVLREDQARREFAVMARMGIDVCLYGHTHSRRIFRAHAESQRYALAESSARHKVTLDSRPAVAFGSPERYLINVGSVSENRDDGLSGPQAGLLTPWWYAHLRLGDFRRAM